MIFSIIIKQENKYNLTVAIEVVFQFGTSKCDTSTVCFALDFMTGKEKLKLLYLVWLESWLCAKHDGSFVLVIEPSYHYFITKSHKFVGLGAWSNSDVYRVEHNRWTPAVRTFWSPTVRTLAVRDWKIEMIKIIEIIIWP